MKIDQLFTAIDSLEPGKKINCIYWTFLLQKCLPKGKKSKIHSIINNNDDEIINNNDDEAITWDTIFQNKERWKVQEIQ